MTFISSDHPFISCCYWFLRKVFGFFIKIILIKKVHGIENIPLKGSAIVVFNHQSFFDFICFASITPRNIHYLSAEKFFEHWLWKYLMIFTGQIKVNRKEHDKSELYNMVKKHINKGKIIGIFPEGTRSPYKYEMLKMYNGAAHFALKHHVPIIPVGIIGTYEVMNKTQSRPILKKIVEINIGNSMSFIEHHDHHDNKQICTSVMERVINKIEILSGKKYKHYESTT